MKGGRTIVTRTHETLPWSCPGLGILSVSFLGNFNMVLGINDDFRNVKEEEGG